MIGKAGLQENQDKPHAVIFKQAPGQGRLSCVSSAKKGRTPEANTLITMFDHGS